MHIFTFKLSSPTLKVPLATKTRMCSMTQVVVGVFLNTKDLNHTPASAAVALAKTVTLIFGEMLRGEQSFGAAGFSGSQAGVVELFAG